MKNFWLGFSIGIFSSMILWSSSVYFHVSVSLTQGVTGSLVLAIFCGTFAIIGDLDELMDNLPW